MSMSQPTDVSSILVEVCVESAADAAVAAEAGVHRLELNSALELGGLTPSPGLLQAVREVCSLPIVCMLRPRAGDFQCSDLEFKTMAADADWMIDAGASGLAFGILDSESRVAVDRCRLLRERISGVDAVFHRAIDFVPDPYEAMETLIDLGFNRILTSGQEASAVEGADLIRRLIERSRGRIEILPGGGVRPGIVRELVHRTGCRQIHGSFRSRHGQKRPDALSKVPPELASMIHSVGAPVDASALKELFRELNP